MSRLVLRLGFTAVLASSLPRAMALGRTSALTRRGLCLSVGASAVAIATAGAPPALAKPAVSDGTWAKRSEPFTDADFAGFTTTASGLEFKTVEEGYGVKPPPGSGIKAHYAGYLLTGAKFDSSYDRRSPLGFNVGTGRVIKGWDEALLDMKVGEKRVRTSRHLGRDPEPFHPRGPSASPPTLGFAGAHALDMPAGAHAFPGPLIPCVRGGLADPEDPLGACVRQARFWPDPGRLDARVLRRARRDHRVDCWMSSLERGAW
jgi:hypothetical protein